MKEENKKEIGYNKIETTTYFIIAAAACIIFTLFMCIGDNNYKTIPLTFIYCIISLMAFNITCIKRDSKYTYIKESILWWWISIFTATFIITFPTATIINITENQFLLKILFLYAFLIIPVGLFIIFVTGITYIFRDRDKENNKEKSNDKKSKNSNKKSKNNKKN